MPNKNSSEYKISTSPNQKTSQNTPRSGSISATNAITGAYPTYSSTAARRNSDVSTTTPNSPSVTGSNQRIVDNHYATSPLSSILPSYHANKLKNNQTPSKVAPLLNRSTATNQFAAPAINGLTNLGNDEKFAYMVNNEEFPALNDSVVIPCAISNERNATNALLENANALGDYEPPLYDGFYVNRSYGAAAKGHSIAGGPSKCVDLTRYYTLSIAESPFSNIAVLEKIVTNLKLTQSNDTIASTGKRKNSRKFIEILKRKKNVNGASLLIKMFPLIDQVKMSYPFSKFSVGASVDIPLNLYHYIHKDPESVSQYIAPLIESCPITSLYRVAKHLDDYFVPLDYLTLAKFHEKSPFSCDKYSDEILLFLYYSHVRDGLQMLAAYHLHRRGWRFHLSKRQWITLTNDQYKSYNSLLNNKKPTASTVVKDTFWFFNVYKWCMEKAETALDFKLFESVDIYAGFLQEASNSRRNGQNTALISQNNNENIHPNIQNKHLQHVN